MINNVVLVGRLTKDSDLRYTASGVPVATFTLAVNRNFKKQDGSREADFINCVIWRKLAESFANYTKKGVQVAVTGRLQTRNYENANGTRTYVTEVICDTFQLLDKREDQSNESVQPSSQEEQFSDPSRNIDPFQNSTVIDISDDDLPF